MKHDFLQYDCAIFAILVGAGLFTDLFVVVEHVEGLHEAERGEDEEDEEDGESEVCHVHPDGGHEVGQRQQGVAQPCSRMHRWMGTGGPYLVYKKFSSVIACCI